MPEVGWGGAWGCQRWLGGAIFLGGAGHVAGDALVFKTSLFHKTKCTVIILDGQFCENSKQKDKCFETISW